MTFVAGAIIGVVVGVVAAGLLARRRGSSDSAAPASRDRGVAVAIGIATIALVVSAVALARSDQNSEGASTTTTSTLAATSSSALAATTSTASPTTTLPSSVVVPNLVGLARDDAVAALTGAGLKSTIQVLTLANVPPGFVISQNPLAASSVDAGSTVALVVSAAA